MTEWNKQVSQKVRATDLVVDVGAVHEFESMAECAKHFGFSRTWITKKFARCPDGKTFDYAGYRFRKV